MKGITFGNANKIIVTNISNYYYIDIDIYVTSTFVSPFIPFTWREPKLFTRQVNVQLGKSTLFIITTKGKTLTLTGNKHLSLHFFLQKPRLFPPRTEKVPA